MNSRLAVISLWAEDVPRTAHFYRDILGLTLVPHHGDRPHIDLGGTYLVILRGNPVPAQNVVPLGL
jgi:catechol 2,3-dioxygenase-like lactoylglutathione lyase family enzyme